MFETLILLARNYWSCQDLSFPVIDTNNAQNFVAVGTPALGAVGPTPWLPRAISVSAGNILSKTSFPLTAGLAQTFCVWLQRTENVATFKAVIGRNNQTFGMNSSLPYSQYDGVSASGAPAPSFANLDWHFCAFVRDNGTSGRIYVDGIESIVSCPNDASTVATLEIPWSAAAWDINVAGVGFWESPLSFSDLEALRAGPLSQRGRRRRGSGRIKVVRR